MKLEVVVNLEDADLFKQQFILEPTKIDTSQLAEHLSGLVELKDLMNSESAAYNAEYLCGDPAAPKQISLNIEIPLSQFFHGNGLKFIRIESLSPARVNPPPQQSTAAVSGKESANSRKLRKVWHIPFITAVIVLFIVVAGLGCYYVYGSTTISKNNNTIASLNNTIASDNSTISSQQNAISNGKSQITNLRSQISSLQNEVNLTLSTSEIDGKIVNEYANSSVRIVSFTANYAGYIIVSGTSTTSNGYIRVDCSSSAYPTYSMKYTLGTSAIVTCPILPGTVQVYFGNSNLVASANATITLTYYY